MDALSFDKVRTVPLRRRRSKVHLSDLAHGRNFTRGASFARFWEGLPNILASKDLKELVGRLRTARSRKKPIVLMFGAHLIKTGLSPIILQLMREGWVTVLAANGASVIHDFELSFAGITSEDVARNLSDGSFGMAKETGEFVNKAAKEAASSGRGLGETVGRLIAESGFPNRSLSLFAEAWRLGLTATVHVGIGTDIIYQHPNCDGAAWGESSYRDFRVLAGVLSKLGGGGVVLNVGSAVILPEVFLKALTVARNLGHPVRNFTTANFDMYRMYRPTVNVVERPVLQGGKGYSFTGHHEILLPLLAQALLEKR
jgi:hypothetical protein